MAAVGARRSQSFVGARHRACLARKDAAVAVNAIARELTGLIYLMITRVQEYIEKGVEAFAASLQPVSAGGIPRTSELRARSPPTTRRANAGPSGILSPAPTASGFLTRSTIWAGDLPAYGPLCPTEGIKK